MLVPLPFDGSLRDFNDRTDLHKGYEWVNKINKNKHIYLALFQRWPSSNGTECDLPMGYDLYIVSFHLEAVDILWLKNQIKRTNSEIIVLHDGTANNYTIPKVRFISYYYWHIQLDTMTSWFGFDDTEKHITHKASAFCNRISNTKLITFTAIAEYMGTDNCMLVLHDWLEDKNIYSKNQYIPPRIKELFNIFFEKYYGTEYKIDDFTNDLNYQKHTANPWQPAYQNCAIHFTNESFDNTSMYINGISNTSALYSYPGPFLTEKTFKCLMGGTAFVPTGQYDTYGALEKVGFKFEYNFDTSFDSITKDENRLIAIIDLIETMSSMSPNEIYEGTMESSEHNYNYIKGGRFYKDCEILNEHTIEQVIEHIDLVTG
jgi:hypothetical protein